MPDQVRAVAQRLPLVSPIALEVHGNTAACLLHCVIFRTTAARERHVDAVGQCEERVVTQDGRRWDATHCVVVPTRMLEISTSVLF